MVTVEHKVIICIFLKQELVEGMSVDNLRKLVLQVVQRQPGMLFDLMEVPPGEPAPPPTRGRPAWCRCDHCVDMPTDLEKLC